MRRGALRCLFDVHLYLHWIRSGGRIRRWGRVCAELTWSRKTAATALANAEEKLPKYWEHLAETGATRVGALGTAEQRLHFAVYPKRAASPPPRCSAALFALRG